MSNTVVHRLRTPGEGPRIPKILKILFGCFFVLLHYFFLITLVYVIRHPLSFHEISAFIFVVAVDIFSLYFMVYHRRQTIGILHDACAALYYAAPERLDKINRYFKYITIAYVLYSLVVLVLQLASDETVRGTFVANSLATDNTDFLLFSENLDVSRWVEITFTWIEIILEASALFVLGGFLVILWSYLFSVVAELGLSLSDYLEELGFNKVNSFNERLLTVVVLIERLNRLLGNLLVLWFAVALYSSCFSVMWYIRDNNLLDQVSLNFKLPYMFQEILDLLFLTLAGSRIPNAMGKAARKLLFMSKDALLAGKTREYEYMQGQLNGGWLAGVKLGGMFLITRKMFLSYLGIGFTYVVVSIQINPLVFRKLQGDIEKTLEPNASDVLNAEHVGDKIHG